MIERRYASGAMHVGAVHADAQRRALHRSARLLDRDSIRERLSNRVFDGLDRAGLDELPGRFGLEYRRLFGEWVDALACLGGRLFDDHELGKARQHESPGLLELLVADARQRLDDAFDILSRQTARMLVRNCLNEFRLRHLLHADDLSRITLGLKRVDPLCARNNKHRFTADSKGNLASEGKSTSPWREAGSTIHHRSASEC